MESTIKRRLVRPQFFSDFGKPLLLVVLAACAFAISLTVHAAGLSTMDAAPVPNSSVHAHVLSAATTLVTGAQTSPSRNLAPARSAAPASNASCTANRPYVAPGTFDLSTMPDGLTILRDPTYTYSVSGQSLRDLRTNLLNCRIRQATAGNFHAITSRNIDWSYSETQEGDVCRLDSIKVGLHIAQFMPTLRNAPANVAAQWNIYQTNLAGHEEGHVNIAREYAGKILNDLRSAQSADCTTLSQHASLMINSDLNALNTADETYDAQTNHGATQGAIL